MSARFPPILPLGSIPQNIRSIAHLVKIANEYSERDIVIYYWCLLKAVEDAMSLDSASTESKKFLAIVMNILEQIKKEARDNDAILHDVVAQSHIEDQAQKLFSYAISQDDAGEFNPKMVKAFFTCGCLFDVLCMFGPLDENLQSARKYAKWRATYIFGCLKRGEQPVPGDQLSNDKNIGEVNDVLSAEFSASARINTDSQGIELSETEHFYGDDLQQKQFSANARTIWNTTTNDQHSPNIGSQPGFYPRLNPTLNIDPTRPSLHSRIGPKALSTASLSPSKIGTVNPIAAQNLKLEDYLEAKKYTKFASSALDYEDPKTAIDYLQKAIDVLQKQH